MECPKCRKQMHKERDGFLCFCGMWVESQADPVMKMSREQWAKKPVGKHVGVARGTRRSDAAPLAVKFFDSISDLLKQSASWRSISILVKSAAPEARFDVKSLKKFYELEMDKRGGMTA